MTVANHKLDKKEGFWTEASMGSVVGYLAIGGGIAVIAAVIAAIVVLGTTAFVTSGIGIGLTNGFMSLGLLGSSLFVAVAATGIVGITAIAAAVGEIIAAGLAGQSMYEMIYMPADDEYDMADDDEDLHPTILIQRFDNYVCYDPDPVHAL